MRSIKQAIQSGEMITCVRVIKKQTNSIRNILEYSEKGYSPVDERGEKLRISNFSVGTVLECVRGNDDFERGEKYHIKDVVISSDEAAYKVGAEFGWLWVDENLVGIHSSGISPVFALSEDQTATNTRIHCVSSTTDDFFAGIDYNIKHISTDQEFFVIGEDGNSVCLEQDFEGRLSCETAQFNLMVGRKDD